jgi:hypothetical protein
MSFKERYMEMKLNGLRDREIAKEMGICKDTLTRRKKIFGVRYTVKRIRKNKSGISERDIQKGVERGVPRMRILKRMRSGWSVEEAINSPYRRRLAK